ncbi:conserved hypothetical protein [Trichinella spiralis]|uniref:hypothetical protein n=1 Tax=Trichinella spiralis TaxID=6334 RepID=UPI0001EFE623|nr:conserved hypothetical protein [Trichinella spiralis]XP_003367794.1 conserved hypothetical protein [Trichinella spiralis]XP_003370536.1 conserved hypothetical protein [Trichinella spiralis]
MTVVLRHQQIEKSKCFFFQCLQLASTTQHIRGAVFDWTVTPHAGLIVVHTRCTKIFTHVMYGDDHLNGSNILRTALNSNCFVLHEAPDRHNVPFPATYYVTPLCDDQVSN